jgi:hypothetical protein
VILNQNKTFTDLIKRASLLCGDPESERWPVARVGEAVNDAAMEFCLRTRLIKEVVNITLSAERIFYDVAAAVEGRANLRDYGFPFRLAFNGRRQAGMWPTSLQRIDLLGASNQLAESRPFRWHLDSVSPSTVAIYGIPSGDGYDPTVFSRDEDYGLLLAVLDGDDRLTYDDEAALRAVDGPITFTVYRDADGRIVRELVALTDENNMQVHYYGLPVYMDTGDDTADGAIPWQMHEGLSHGAAARLLDEGTAEELSRGLEAEAVFERHIRRQNADTWRGHTPNYDMRP